MNQTVIVTRMAGRTPVPAGQDIASLAAHGAAMVIFLSAGMLDALQAGAYDAALADISTGKGQSIPPYMRPSNNYAGYKYPHDFPNRYVVQQYLPDDLKDRKYYSYAENKTEQAAMAYWDKIKNSTK